MEIGEDFSYIPFSVVDQFFKKKTPDFFEAKLVRVGAGSGLGLGLGLVSKVVFSAFFEIFGLITLEPHADHNQVPDSYTLSYIIIQNCGKGGSREA